MLEKTAALSLRILTYRSSNTVTASSSMPSSSRLSSSFKMEPPTVIFRHLGLGGKARQFNCRHIQCGRSRGLDGKLVTPAARIAFLMSRPDIQDFTCTSWSSWSSIPSSFVKSLTWTPKKGISCRRFSSSGVSLSFCPAQHSMVVGVAILSANCESQKEEVEKNGYIMH